MKPLTSYEKGRIARSVTYYVLGDRYPEHEVYNSNISREAKRNGYLLDLIKTIVLLSEHGITR